MTEVNFGQTADDYAKYRMGFPESFFDRLKPLGIGRPGQTIVDLGTGTGTLARGFALRGCRVIGVDVAPAMLEAARRIDRVNNVSVDYRLARAEETGLPEHETEVVIAGQCWHWFDRAAAAREVKRILRITGRVVIAHLDWIPLPGNIVDETERLILSHNPDWKDAGGNGFHPEELRDLWDAGFTDIESFTYDVDIAYSPEAWRGRVRASAGIGATLSTEAVKAFDWEMMTMLKVHYPGPLLHIYHRVFVVTAHPPLIRQRRTS
jgi:SAM-dependent methyltransferase